MNLFSITAPLVIRYPDGTKHLAIEIFKHPDGLIYFRPFWHITCHGDMIHLIEGVIKGDGPWKAGDCTISIAGCHGTDLDIALELADWQGYLMEHNGEYMPGERVQEEALRCGAIIE
jgi:hypothetical protein